ncbi:MAG: peptide chain release factor N(5)-glutamine methyltransferase [Candidatus Saccharimonas sp.]
MNASSKPKTLNNNQWIRDAAEQLASAGIATARLDAEIILAHTIRRSRTWIHAHGDELLDPRRLEIANARLELRLDRVPIAYIIGHKEFYTRLFTVTPATLIPRPESESIISLLKQYIPPTAKYLIDVGTGSGCLGITAKLELPHLSVTLSDISRHALNVAESNATTLNATVTLQKSDLLSALEVPTSKFDCIVANLPYVDTTWERSPETDHEPNQALFADEKGLALIYKLIAQTPLHLSPGGLLILEADPTQHQAILDYSITYSLTLVASDGYAIALRLAN